jgi:hypothetical protein
VQEQGPGLNKRSTIYHYINSIFWGVESQRLGFELTASHLQSRSSQSRLSINWAIPPVHFALVILKIESRKLYLLKLVSKGYPPYLSLPSSYDYKARATSTWLANLILETAFSKMLCSWNHTVCSFFRLGLLSLSRMYLKFSDIFSRINSSFLFTYYSIVQLYLRLFILHPPKDILVASSFWWLWK